jgi:hypothetical protein
MATFVLIPGAGGEAWYWHRVVPELQSFGHQAVAVDLPAGDDAAGWDEYVAAIEPAVEGRTDVILVAQSLAGFSADRGASATGRPPRAAQRDDPRAR